MLSVHNRCDEAQSSTGPRNTRRRDRPSLGGRTLRPGRETLGPPEVGRPATLVATCSVRRAIPMTGPHQPPTHNRRSPPRTVHPSPHPTSIVTSLLLLSIHPMFQSSFPFIRPPPSCPKSRRFLQARHSAAGWCTSSCSSSPAALPLGDPHSHTKPCREAKIRSYCMP